MNNKKKTVIVPAVAVAAIVAALMATNVISITGNKSGFAAPDNGCLPKLVNPAMAVYPIKQPSAETLPKGYSLQAVDDPGDAVVMYYSDYSMCPFTESFDGQIKKGAIVVTVNQPEGIAKDSTDFQQKELNYYASQNGTLAKVQPIDVNGNKGVGWEPFTGTDTVRQDGVVVSSEPLPMPGMVRFYDDSSGTLNTVTATSLWRSC